MKELIWLLHRIEPAHNRKRYYYIAIQPTLLDIEDTLSVVRVYGRIGGAQQIASPLQCRGEAEALKVVEGLLRKRFRNGYELVVGEQLADQQSGRGG